MQQLIVIEGPTASGKTALAVALAKHLNTVVLSADSRQFYREIAIGTAKPTVAEMKGIPHYFIDSHSLETPVTAGIYEQEAMALIRDELKTFQQLILVGGSGMFIDALCIGLDPIPTDPEIQLQVRVELETKGIGSLLLELQTKDPEYFNEVDRQNPARVIRALEVIRNTGFPFSAQRKRKPAERPFEVIRFVLDHPRNVLYDRINRRVDTMVEQGLIEEVKSVNHLRHLASLHTVGYSEVFDFLDEKYTLATCIEKIKQHTRNYAKRQLTWFRRHPEAHWITYNSAEDALRKILQTIDRQAAAKLE